MNDDDHNNNNINVTVILNVLSLHAGRPQNLGLPCINLKPTILYKCKAQSYWQNAKVLLETEKERREEKRRKNKPSASKRN